MERLLAKTVVGLATRIISDSFGFRGGSLYMGVFFGNFPKKHPTKP